MADPEDVRLNIERDESEERRARRERERKKRDMPLCQACMVFSGLGVQSPRVDLCRYCNGTLAMPVHVAIVLYKPPVLIWNLRL